MNSFLNLVTTLGVLATAAFTGLAWLVMRAKVRPYAYIPRDDRITHHGFILNIHLCNPGLHEVVVLAIHGAACEIGDRYEQKFSNITFRAQREIVVSPSEMHAEIVVSVLPANPDHICFASLKKSRTRIPHCYDLVITAYSRRGLPSAWQRVFTCLKHARVWFARLLTDGRR